MRTTPDQFDYVIVGAGPAGCVLANRLSADPNISVCLLEAGPRDTSPFLQIPAGVYSASSNPNYAWQFGTEPSEGTANRSIPMPQGKTLGGSTAINGMNYNRGAPEDYDDWCRRGNRGWAYTDLLPYFKKSERRVGACDVQYRGLEGPLPITDSDWRHPACDLFIRSAARIGIAHNPDYNGASQAGTGYYQRYIERGWRISAASAFLRPIRKRPNLSIRTNAQAVGISLEGKRAIGVHYMRGVGAPVEEVRVRREIILSAGAANTPKLLELSGIGSERTLRAIGIPILHELPGVGENLQDHYMVHLVVSIKGMPAISGHGLSLVREATKWLTGYPSILAISPSLVYGFINSERLGARPDIQLDVALGNYSRRARERVPVLKVGYYQLRPKSRGYVHARSADPFQAPLIQPNYLDEADDQQVAIRGIAALRRLLSNEPIRDLIDTEELPGSGVKSDAACLKFAREAGLTAYHLCGSCQMGPRSEPLAVVDDQLRVCGLHGLRIADASIMPSIPSANTSAAAFMIGEKAADLVLGRAVPVTSVTALAG